MFHRFRVSFITNIKHRVSELRKCRLLSVWLPRMVHFVPATFRSVCKPGCCSGWGSGWARSWLCNLRCRYYWGLASVLVCYMHATLEPQYAPMPVVRYKAVGHDIPRKCHCRFWAMEHFYARTIFEVDCFLEKSNFGFAVIYVCLFL